MTEGSVNMHVTPDQGSDAGPRLSTFLQNLFGHVLWRPEKTGPLLAILLAVLTLGVPGTALSGNENSRSVETATSFRQAFAGHFLIGAALSKDQIMGRETGMLDFVARQFSALTAENEMKWERIHPAEHVYAWETADRLVAFCEANDIFLTGHTLVWHQQTPDWVFENAEGQPASRELLLARMEEHIKTVAGHFKGAVPSWDVVNEALNDDGTMRDTKWRRIIGDDYVEKAFAFAHAADPEARLYYNDYNLYKPEKRAGALRLVKSIQDKGIPVHGIGMQGHYGLGHPEDLSMIEDSIQAFATLGEVMITELDMTVLKSPDTVDEGADISIDLALNAKYNPYAGGLPADVQALQAQRFLDMFKIFLDNQASISRVTFWGVNDAQSWRNDWPMQGRTDYPLMIDRNNAFKPVVYDLFRLTERYPVSGQ